MPPPPSLSTSESAGAPPPALAVDAAALSRWLETSVPSYPRGAPVAVTKFSHGQSNPTYLVQVGRGDGWGAGSGRGVPAGANAPAHRAQAPPSWRAVLRKKPPGAVLATAHAVEREAALLRALDARVPAPRVLASCDDPAVVGTPFYVMQFVDGRVFVDPGLPELKEEDRRGTYASLARALATLHAVPAASIPPLARAAGRGPSAYGSRQVAVWQGQVAAAVAAGAASPPPELAALGAFLAAAAPAVDTGTECVVLHGDYRLDNAVMDRESQGEGGFRPLLGC